MTIDAHTTRGEVLLRFYTFEIPTKHSTIAYFSSLNKSWSLPDFSSCFHGVTYGMQEHEMAELYSLRIRHDISALLIDLTAFQIQDPQRNFVSQLDTRPTGQAASQVGTKACTLRSNVRFLRHPRILSPSGR